VEAVGAFDVLRGHYVVKCLRGQKNRAVLPAAQASVSTDQGFERCDVEGDAFDAAVEVEIGRLRHQDSAPEHPDRVVAVRLQRVLSGHLTGVQPDTARGADGPWHTGCVQTGDKADALVCRQAGKELGPALSEVIQREPDWGVDIQQTKVSRTKYRDRALGPLFGALVHMPTACGGGSARGSAGEAAAGKIFG